jgi:hypothetical protein
MVAEERPGSIEYAEYLLQLFRYLCSGLTPTAFDQWMANPTKTRSWLYGYEETKKLARQSIRSR